MGNLEGVFSPSFWHDHFHILIFNEGAIFHNWQERMTSKKFRRLISKKFVIFCAAQIQNKYRFCKL